MWKRGPSEVMLGYQTKWLSPISTGCGARVSGEVVRGVVAVESPSMLSEIDLLC